MNGTFISPAPARSGDGVGAGGGGGGGSGGRAGSGGVDGIGEALGEERVTRPVNVQVGGVPRVCGEAGWYAVDFPRRASGRVRSGDGGIAEAGDDGSAGDGGAGGRV